MLVNSISILKNTVLIFTDAKKQLLLKSIVQNILQSPAFLLIENETEDTKDK